jgi:hypothetical protein
MPKIEYQQMRLRRDTLRVIQQANEIIDEYSEKGYELTLRQLYYQFVSRDLIPNRQKEYTRLGSIINDGRLAGLIDWDAITDRTRNLQSVGAWNDPSEILEVYVDHFHISRWIDQDYRPEVWIEKDALAGIIEGPCKELDTPFFSCRGYTSQSEMWTASRRYRARREAMG